MVGNYGVPNPDRMDEIGLPKGFESDKIHASALIVQDYSETYSHWNAKMSLGDWLKREVWKILPWKFIRTRDSHSRFTFIFRHREFLASLVLTHAY